MSNVKKAKYTADRTDLLKNDSTKVATTKAPSAQPSSVLPAAVKTAPVQLVKPAPTPAVAPRPSAPVQTAPIRPAPTIPEAPKRGHVSLELLRPDAKTVFVAGSFNEWKPEKSPLILKGNGRWVGDLSIKPGRHEYLFVVDGQWLPDPNAKESVQNPFGGRNSILTVLS
jgi:hypothetical protein